MIAKMMAVVLLCIFSFSSVAMVHRDIRPIERKSVVIINRTQYPIIFIVVFGPDTSSMYLPGIRVVSFGESVIFRINTSKGCWYTFLLFSSDGYSNQLQLNVCWHKETSFITLDPSESEEK